MSNNETLGTALQDLQRQADGQVPGFEAAYAAAEGRSRARYRMRFTGLAAAAAIAAIALTLLPDQQDEFTYIKLEELTSTTSWSAPSDSLLPQHQFDLYRELPGMFESTDMSTNTDEGALL